MNLDLEAAAKIVDKANILIVCRCFRHARIVFENILKQIQPKGKPEKHADGFYYKDKIMIFVPFHSLKTICAAIK